MRQDRLTVIWLLAPALLIILVFRILPIFFSVRLSLYDWGIAGPKQFVGLLNYKEVLTDPIFYSALSNTFWYTFFSVPLNIFISLSLALFLNTRIKGLGVYRTIYYLPVVTSIIAASIVWRWIFNPERGLFNYFLDLLRINPVRWLEDPRGIFSIILAPLKLDPQGFFAGPSVALFALILMAVWKGVGFNVVIYLAGLQNISKEYYEAARIDGAGRFYTFWKITWPLLSPTTFYILVMSTIVAFETFAQIWVMTGPPPGGPLGTTKLVMYYFYEQAFELWRMGYGSAIAFCAFFIILALTIFQKTVIEPRVHYE